MSDAQHQYVRDGDQQQRDCERVLATNTIADGAKDRFAECGQAGKGGEAGRSELQRVTDTRQ